MSDARLRLGYSLLTVRPGQIGGAETYVRDLLACFLEREDFETVRILANGDVAAAYGRSGADVRFVAGMEPGGHPVGRTLRLARGVALPKTVLRDAADDLDLVHFPVAVGAPVPSGIPHAVTLHDVAHHAVPDFFSRADRAYRAVAYDRSAKRADLVITVSEHARRQIIEYLGIDERRIVAIHSGIDLDRYSPRGDQDDEILDGLAVPERFVYFPANMWDHKNHERLVRAFGLVSDSDLDLVLTGQTYGRDAELAEWTRRAGVTSRVHHLGYVPWAAVPALYRRAVAMVFPSMFEGFGSPPLEAMACGCPVASSRAGSLEEVLGGAALAFDPENEEEIAQAIDQIASDAELRERLRLEARPQAERFTWRAAADAHAVAYRTLI